MRINLIFLYLLLLVSSEILAQNKMCYGKPIVETRAVESNILSESIFPRGRAAVSSVQLSIETDNQSLSLFAGNSWVDHSIAGVSEIPLSDNNDAALFYLLLMPTMSNVQWLLDVKGESCLFSIIDSAQKTDLVSLSVINAGQMFKKDGTLDDAMSAISKWQLTKLFTCQKHLNYYAV